jgi:hypothetical protein
MNQILNNFNKPKITNLIANCVITKRPLLVVEGKDDIQFYDNIALEIDKSLIIRAVETINGYTEGADEVIDLTKDIQNELIEQNELQSLYLGVIDKDIREFRTNDIRSLEVISNYINLFILEYYSFESHFINKSILKSVLKDLTNVNNQLLIDNFVLNLFNLITEKIVNELYYPALEALQNAIVSDYIGVLGYSNKYPEIINNPEIMRQINNKIYSLDLFAESLNINRSFDTLILFCKGKWILSSFTKFIKEEILNLTSKCKNNEVQQCQYCEIQDFHKCLYKPKFPIQNFDLNKNIMMNIKSANVDYIIQKISQLN